MRGGLAGLFVAIFTLAALFALTGYQVTGETAGTRLLGRLAGSLVEIDRWVPAHREDISLLAKDRGQGTLPLSDMPVEVNLPVAVAIDADEDTLRDAIVRIMGMRLYDEGASAFRDPDGNRRSLSVAEPVRWTTELISGMHGVWTVAMLLAVLALLASCAAMALGGVSPLTPLAVGGAIASVGAAGGWLLATAASGVFESAVDKEIMLIARDGAFIGLRNSVAVEVVFLTLLGLLALSRRAETRSREAWTQELPPSDESFV